MARGKVKWFSDKRGFGFITDPEVAVDVFVHYSAIEGAGFKTLTKGDEVEYELAEEGKGAKALKVVRLSGARPKLPHRKS